MDSIEWAAGIYEGEGCCSFQRGAHRGGRKDGKPRSSWPFLRVKMCDEDIIRRFHAAVGIGNVRGPLLSPSAAKLGHKPLWEWTAGSEDAQAVARMLLPFLGDRRTAQILPLLDWKRVQARHAACGTESGRVRHQRLGEPVCDVCKAARREAYQCLKQQQSDPDLRPFPTGQAVKTS